MLGISIESQVSPLLVKLRHVALDMDGTLYKGETLFPETVPFLEKLRALGIGYTFLTNNPSRSRRDCRDHFSQLGIPAVLEEIRTPVQATIRHLRAHFSSAAKLCFLGTLSMIEEFQEAGYAATEGEPDAVIVAFDPTMSYGELARVAWWIAQGKPYIATNPDRVCPTDQPLLLPDCGAICAALKAATGRSPDIVIGKPSPALLDEILVEHRLHPSQLAMVGDRLYTDIEMARRAGALGVLVLTGEATADTAGPAPDLIVDHVGKLGELLAEARQSSAQRSVVS